jgi:dTDP-4-dehydrorhamnose 3,5-epimerase-like enzyme
MRQINRPSIVDCRPDLDDTRGRITHIIRDEMIKRVTIIHSRKGSIRGNHYHITTGHYVFVVDGILKLVFEAKHSKITRTIRPGHLIWIPPKIPHAFEALEESTALEMASMDYGSKDTCRLDDPLI